MKSNMPLWFDAGVNLFSDRFHSDRDAVVQHARNSQVSELLLISSDVAESTLNTDYCLNHPALYCTAGVHPHYAGAVCSDWQEQIEVLLRSPAVVAVGECGLDFDRNFSTPEQQIQVFETQLQLASRHQKPVYLHERAAFSTQIALLQRYAGLTGIAHCFTGDTSQLKAYLDLGLYIGITGWLCDSNRGQALMEAVSYLPLDRLILETDAPFLLPKTMTNKPKSRRNEPAFLPEIAAQLSSLTGHSLEDIALHSRRNCLKLFQITPDGHSL
ncbi:MAG: TatD family hydrolase [Gammaproteobacteria bacterium]|nr:TatD family hydrolase [Gammaproteobacteria bacterium]MBU2059165.1 TatD family hydrolase [Gammaproteobacteria bacterium]MBU2173716.1 TatD family hydrolase [Gammaproteobacteria bacterium]MBU2246872.1 TatD family hydrolase [Gammaproteobacteria bacterium]MBU2343442.1 TatD family hydrolase [Gammaproteobacteria bacterium]